KGKLINCYLSSYNKTDDMIKKIFGMLQKNEKSFSLVYFSDHGLNIVGGNNEFKVYRNDSVKQSYEIPFFISSSDSADTTEINVTRSAYNFFNYFPTWIGVTTNLTPKGYDIFSDTNDTPVVMSYDSKLKPLSSKTDGLTASDIFNK
ncbi:TPA: sulfatase-like hydrolase/transferase, partial [Escherichia coli]|nr:sulfatase-like hydrolase/transferase [Escherichia coli]